MKRRRLVGGSMFFILLVLLTYTALQIPDPSEPPAVTVDDLLQYPAKYEGEEVWFTDTIAQKTERHGKTIFYFHGRRVQDRLRVIFKTDTPGQETQTVSVQGRLTNSIFYGEAIKTVNKHIITFRRGVSVLALIPLLTLFFQTYTITVKSFTIRLRDDDA